MTYPSPLASSLWARFVRLPLTCLSLGHLVLGALFAWQPDALPVWLLLLMLLFFLRPQEQQLRLLPYLLLSLLPIELIGRMSGASPWVPWELGKYAMIGLMGYALFLLPKRQIWWPGAIWILLSIPGILITTMQSSRWWGDVVFNGFGLIALALGCMVFGKQRISTDGRYRLLRFGFSSFLTGLAFIVLESDWPWEVAYTLYCTYEVSGGFNPNQVATYLSWGMLLSAAPKLWQGRHQWSFMIAYAGISGWTWLTFSRGGLYAALITLLLAGLLVPKASMIHFGKRLQLPYFLVVLALSAASFAAANAISDQMLLRRYMGDRPDIISGEVEKSLDTYVSYRWALVQSDWEMFLDYFPWGTGVGQARPKRMSYDLPENFPPHTEATRLLSEHGLPGLLMMLLLLGLPVWLFFQARGKPEQQLHYVLFFGLALLSSSHSAMRTMITPMLYALACMRIENGDNIQSKTLNR